MDINVKTDIGNIIVEINNGYYNSLPIRNLVYLSSGFSNSVSRGGSYDNIPLHILLNITWWKGLGGDILTDYYIQSDKKETQKYSHFLMLGLDKKDLNYLCKKEGHKYMKKYMKN